MTSIAPKQVGLVGAVANQTVAGAITVVGSIEQYRVLDFAQTTAGNLALTLPNPSDPTVQFVLDLINTGTANCTVQGFVLNASSAISLVWSGTAWLAAPTSSIAATESPSVTAQNTVSNLTGFPNVARPVAFFVNGIRVANGAGIALGGANNQVVTVTPATLGYNIATTDSVVVTYFS